MIFGVSHLQFLSSISRTEVKGPDFIAKSHVLACPECGVTSLFIDFHPYTLGCNSLRYKRRLFSQDSILSTLVLFLFSSPKPPWICKTSMWFPNCYCLLFLGLSPLAVWRHLPHFSGQLLGDSPLFVTTQSQSLAHLEDCTKQLLRLYSLKNDFWCSFLWKTRGTALRQVTDLVTRASSGMKDPVTPHSLLSRDQRQQQPRCTHAGWEPAGRWDGFRPCCLACTCLLQELFLSCFYQCFCWAIGISKPV